MQKWLIFSFLLFFCTFIFFASPAEAKNYIAPANEPTKLFSKPIVTSSQGGGCITKWGWDGSEWVKRDLINFNGVIIDGDSCVAFDPYYHRLAIKPSIKGDAQDGLLPIHWFRLEQKYRMSFK